MSDGSSPPTGPSWSQAPPGGTPGERPPGPAHQSSGVSKHLGLIWWGVFLIVAGGLLLVNQFVPGADIWRYWPLIIVAVGIRGMFPTATESWSLKRAAEGLTVVVVGVIFLGQMLGYLRWEAWLNIFRLWPLLLVALGLEIIGKNLHSDAVRMLGSLVVIGGLLYGALVMTPSATWWPFWTGTNTPAEQYAFSEPHRSGVREGRAFVNGGVGIVTVSAGSDLAAAAGRSRVKPVFSASVAGRTATVRIDPGPEVWWPGPAESTMDVTLDKAVVWDLDVRPGVSKFTLDLKDLKVRSLKLDAGVSDGLVTIGASSHAGTGGPVKADINAGVSALRIRVPEGDNVRITMTAGLTGVDVRGDWQSSKDGDKRVWESRGFSDGGAWWDISIQAGVGSIEVTYY